MNVKEQIKLKKWAASMAEQQASGLSISQWCHMKGISASGFHYRSKRVREAMQDIADSPQESNDIVPAQATLQDTKFAKVEIVAPDMDASATTVKERFDANPFEPGTIFLFCGRRNDRIKALVWEGDGFLLMYKRLEAGKFKWPRNADDLRKLTHEQFMLQ